MEIEEFRMLLRSWGKWVQRQNAYPSRSIIENLRSGTGHYPCRSMVPHGIQVPDYLAPVDRAFQALRDHPGRAGELLGAVWGHYALGMTLSECATRVSLSESLFRSRLREGEALLYGWISASALRSTDNGSKHYALL